MNMLIRSIEGEYLRYKALGESASAGEVVVMFPYSAEQHADAVCQEPMMRPLRIWFTFLGTMLLWVSVMDVVEGDESWVGSLTYFILAVLTVGFPFFLKLLLRSMHRRTGQDGRAQAFRFGQKGFALSADAALTPWGLLASATEVKDAFLLTDSMSNHPVYVPKNALSHEELDNLRTMFRTEFVSRSKKLRLLPSG